MKQAFSNEMLITAPVTPLQEAILEEATMCMVYGSDVHGLLLASLDVMEYAQSIRKDLYDSIKYATDQYTSITSLVEINTTHCFIELHRYAKSLANVIPFVREGSIIKDPMQRQTEGLSVSLLLVDMASREDFQRALLAVEIENPAMAETVAYIRGILKRFTEEKLPEQFADLLHIRLTPTFIRRSRLHHIA